MFSDDLDGHDGGEVGWRPRGRGYTHTHTHTHVTNSLCYTTLDSNDTPVKIKSTCAQNKYNFHEILKKS